MIGLILLSQLFTPAESLFAHWLQALPEEDCSAINSVGNVRMDNAEGMFAWKMLNMLGPC